MQPRFVSRTERK